MRLPETKGEPVRCARCDQDGAGLRYLEWWWFCVPCWIAIRAFPNQHLRVRL